MPSPAIASSVARAVLQWFESNSQCQKKVPPLEWTVLAGIVLRSPSSDAESSDTFRVLAAATGNKCLGRRDLNADGLVVNDCHAEVLARRAFLRYLYAEALFWQNNGLESSDQSIFERHSTSHRLVLKPQHSLHLFISEAPCGDAAIYELRQDVVNELVQQREAKTGQADQRERSELRLTGAKAHNKRSRDVDARKDQDTPPDKKFAQAVGIARVKSGRSDLPPEKQTLSMSCSDKLAKWNALGLQGSLLLQWFEPIFLSSITVSEDDKAMSVVKQEQALQRALCTRLRDRNALIDGARMSSLNWTTRESYWTRAQDASTNAKFVAKFFNNFEFEFLVAATGFKQGAKKASKMDQVAMERVASRLAKRNMLRAFHLLSQASLSDNTSDLEYLQLKRAVPVRASCTTPSTSSASTAVVAYNNQREQFFEAFSDWIGVPATFKQFKL
ncbi:Double-stranded RNA-specific adenosine deaminase [Phytophthora nicotianae]|uniref:Double-stranded RNA-specific adenosine deaminase n=1 Tax=Phytophthora nicotianae TaxID=4792 RepID=A0A0W8CG69_PHYNI|nr:Double-stranded RNA-specific adenosine deaminase [Phytophthora nicotianae]